MSSEFGHAFTYNPAMSADEIPVERVSAANLGIQEKPPIAEYTRVPANLYSHFLPRDRLVLGLIFARSVFGEDALGGWVKLGKGIRDRFGLEDRHTRARAVRALERDDIIEVQRRRGSTPLIRLQKTAFVPSIHHVSGD